MEPVDWLLLECGAMQVPSRAQLAGVTYSPIMEIYVAHPSKMSSGLYGVTAVTTVSTLLPWAPAGDGLRWPLVVRSGWRQTKFDASNRSILPELLTACSLSSAGILLKH
jgi:hypothetical protein